MFAFFGSSHLSVIILEILKSCGYIPKLIVTVEDKPSGRKMLLTPPETKVWAEKENLPVLQLQSLKKPESLESIKSFSPLGYDLFIVASYGKIIPDEILNLPRRKTINFHPSLLPKLRGPSPIKSAILSENETGVTLIRLDSEVDHGPIILQEKVEIEDWPPYARDLENILSKVGGEMLCQIIPDWLLGEVQETEQDHSKATFCQKIRKSDGEINLEDNPEKNLRKIRAFHEWPRAFFYFNMPDRTKKRIIIKKARIVDSKLFLEKVVPEGRKEMSFEDFLKGLKES